MVGDYISTSFGSDNLAHGVFALASTPTSGTTCGAVPDNCAVSMVAFTQGLAGGSLSGANDPVLTGGTNNTGAQSLWKSAH